MIFILIQAVKHIHWIRKSKDHIYLWNGTLSAQANLKTIREMKTKN